MQNFVYEDKCKLIFGKNDIVGVVAEIKTAGSKCVLVHYGKNSAVKNGLLETVTTALTLAGIKFVQYGGVQSNPLKSHAVSGVEFAKKNAVDFVLAIGGGSVIDSAKYICVGINNSHAWDLYNVRGVHTDKHVAEPKKIVPLGVVLTIPAAGSESSSGSIIKDDANGQKYGFRHPDLQPRFAFVNPVYCTTLPREQIAYGASDIIAHLLERYFSPCEHVAATDHLLAGAINAMFKIAPLAYADPTNYDVMAEFCLLGTLAHNGMLSMGRDPQSWESHAIEMATISGPRGIAHGQGLAVVFPAWIKYMITKRPQKVVQFARQVMHKRSPRRAIAKLVRFYKSIGLATTYADLKITFNEAKTNASVAFGAATVLGGYGELHFDDITKIIQLASGKPKVRKQDDRAPLAPTQFTVPQ